MIDLFNRQNISQTQDSLIFPKKLRSRHSYGRFNLTLLASIFLPLSLITGINIFINPYNIFDSPTVSGFNQGKPPLLKNARLMKSVQITKVKPKTLLLGSSRADYGLNPNNENLIHQPAYNAALPAATPYEMRRMLQHTLVNQPEIKTVIIGLDEFMFNELNKDFTEVEEHRLEKKHIDIKDILNTTLSYQALAASLETINYSRQHPNHIPYNDRGHLNLRPVDQDSSQRMRLFRGTLRSFYTNFPVYKMSQESLAEIQNIIRICQENQIDCHFFLSPPHATHLQAIYHAGQWPAYEQFKREIVKITPVWDFSGFNSITTEPLNRDIKNYIDSSHYRSEIGDMIISKMLDNPSVNYPKDFGIWLTPDNIDEHLKNTRIAQEAWAKRHPNDVKLAENPFN